MPLRLTITAFVVFAAACSGRITEPIGLGDADPSAPDADPSAPDADPAAPDADPAAPDADPSAPDADPSVPDADPSVPDADPPAPDADPPPPDAVPPPPDAAPPAPDAPLPASCGDGTCDGNGGETCTACASDCDTMDPVCGNGACDTGESSATCYPDCGPAAWPSTWAAWENEVVVLINEHRLAGTDCPDGDVKDPMGTLVTNTALQTASRLHSWDMSYSGYFDHTSCNGRSPWQRAADQGTSAFGETIGSGYSSPAAMVNGWMSSPGHCAILMNSGHTEVGIGYAAEPGRRWTGMFR